MGHYAKRFFGKKIEEPRDPDFVFTVDCRYQTVCRFSLREGPKDVVIDWGNGKTTSITSDAEMYPLMNYNLSGNGGPGIYQIRIKGSFPGIFPDTNYLGRLISLDQWGTNEFTTMEGMFRDETKMEANYTDRPNTSNVTTMDNMFRGCARFNGEVNFDTQNVTTVWSMFRNCFKFNRKVDFNSQKVTDMRSMFSGCTELATPVKLDISSATDISWMFSNAGLAPQSFASWDVTNLIAAINFITLGDMNEPGNTDNYDNTLISWASQDIQRASSTLRINFGASKYSSRAKSARDFLESKNWDITDGGMI